MVIENFVVRLDTNELIIGDTTKHKLSRDMIYVERKTYDGDKYLIWKFTPNKKIKLYVIFLCEEVRLDYDAKCEVLSHNTMKL